MCTAVFVHVYVGVLVDFAYMVCRRYMCMYMFIQTHIHTHTHTH
jgi:hypothetical protein